MDRQVHHQAVQRALELGRGSDPAALQELANLLRLPTAEVRRLAASAIGKLAGFGADPKAAVKALAPVALRDPHPQAQQYALKALKSYGAAAHEHLHDLDELASNPRVKDYLRRAAHSAAEAIREAIRLEQEGARLNAFVVDAKPPPTNTGAASRRSSALSAMPASTKCSSIAETSTPKSNSTRPSPPRPAHWSNPMANG
jgi:HEAT repeat protein